MDIDENLVKLQGALSSFSAATTDHQKLQLLSTIFENVEEPAKIKMVFFMVLNTRMSLTNALKNDANVGLLSDSCQNLDFPALSYIIFNLNLVECLSEIVSNGPVVLTAELLSGVFAYADPRTKIKGLEKVITALFEKILKISKGIHKDICSFKLWEFMNTFGDMMWCRTSYENEDLFEEDMNKILETCLICVNLYNGDLPLSANPLYEISSLHSESVADEFYGVREPDCKTKFERYICKLLDLFHEILSYSFTYDPSEAEIRMMCENAYMLYHNIEKSGIEPSNIFYLENIKIKPETELERISKADINGMVYNIASGKASNKWYKALINFPNVAKNEEAVFCLKSNLSMADAQDLQSIIVLVQEQFQNNFVNDFLLKLYFCCLTKMSIAYQLFHFENYFSLPNRPNLENSTFHGEITEMFNKILDTQANDICVKSRLISFCIRSPIKTIKKICEYALFNYKQLNTSIEDLKMLKTACLLKDMSPEDQPDLDVITLVLSNMIENEEYADREKPFLISLIMRLQEEKILDLEIENSVMRIIRKDLPGGNFDKIQFCLEILETSIKSRSFQSEDIALLGFLSQILDMTSWTYSKFSHKLVKVRETAILIINFVMRNPKFSLTDAELAWIREEVMKTSKINRLYFCDLWYLFDSDLVTSNKLFDQLLLLVHTNSSKRDSIIEFLVKMFDGQLLVTVRISLATALIQILPMLTCKEWILLASHMKTVIDGWIDLQGERTNLDVDIVLFRIFTMSLASLTRDMNANSDLMPCYSYCIRNFGKMIQQNILSCTELSIEAAVVFTEELLFLLRVIQDPDFQRECSITLSPVILEISNHDGGDTSRRGKELRKLENWYRKIFIGQI